MFFIPPGRRRPTLFLNRISDMVTPHSPGPCHTLSPDVTLFLATFPTSTPGRGVGGEGAVLGTVEQNGTCFRLPFRFRLFALRSSGVLHPCYTLLHFCYTLLHFATPVLHPSGRSELL